MGWTSVQAALLPSGWTENVSVQTASDGTILSIEVGSTPRSEMEPGVLLPGLVNAHTHLEQSWRPGLVPGGEGFVGWVRGLMGAVPPEEGLENALRRHAKAMKAQGTAAVSDVASTYDTLPIWAEVGMQGVIQREFLGFPPPQRDAALEAIDAFTGAGNESLWERPTAHAPYSTPPQVIQAAMSRSARGPASIHLAEDLGELEFLASGEGEFAQFMDQLGIDWRWWTPPGLSPALYLQSLGCLGPKTLAVHGVHLSHDDRRVLANTNTPLCLCPRSNLHIGGVLPDVMGLIEAGVTLCLGTDSVASSPDTDVLGEIPVLAQAYPEVPVAFWLDLATRGGADALGLSQLGRIAVGTRPGLLLLEDCVSEAALRESTAFSRRWVSEPGGGT